MPLIQNPDAAQVIREQAKLTLSEGFPQNLSSNVQPVMDMTPRFHRAVDLGVGGSSGTSGNITIHTTSSTKDTYITSAVLSMTKDATCDVASGRVQLQCVVGGAQKAIINTTALTLTAQDKAVPMTFNPPIKVDRNTSITIQGTSTTFTVGAFMRAVSLTGYELV